MNASQSQAPVAQSVKGLGFDANVRVFQKGTRWIAVAMLQTTNGPVKLAASADEASIRQLYGMTLGAARQAAQKMATSKVLAQMSKAPTQPQVPVAPQMSVSGGGRSPAAIVNRLYARLMAGDPQAKASVKRVVQLARTGNQRAAVVHNRLRELYQKDSPKNPPRVAGYGRDIWNGGPPPRSCHNIWGSGPVGNTVPIWGGLPLRASDPVHQPSWSPTFSDQSTTGAHGGGGHGGGGHGGGGHGGGGHGGHGRGAYERHGGHRGHGGRGYGGFYGDYGYGYPYYDEYDPYYSFDPLLDPGYVYVDPIIVGGVGCAKTGYYPFPQSNRAGVTMGGNVQLTPARTRQLLGMIQAARFSR